MAAPTELLSRPPKGAKIRIQDSLYTVTRDLCETSEGKHDWYFECEDQDRPMAGLPGGPVSATELDGKHKIVLPRKLIVVWRLGPDGNIPEPDDPEIVRRRETRSRMRGIRNVPEHYDEVKVYLPREDGAGVSGLLPGVEVRESLEGMTLSDWMMKYAEYHKQGKRFTGIEDVELWFRLAKLLTEALRPLHDERIVHGDLSPRNVILRRTMRQGERTRPSMGDKICFTRQFFADETNVEVFLLETHAAPPRVYRIAEGPTVADGKSKITMKNGTFRRKYDSPLIRYILRAGSQDLERNVTPAQWFAPTDIFSLGIILFELAFGSDAELGPFFEENHAAVEVEGPKNKQVGPKWFLIRGYEARRGNRQLKDALLKAGSKAIAFQAARKGSRSEIGQEKGEALLRMGELILACLRSHTDWTVADLQVLDTVRREFDPGTPGLWFDSESEDAAPFDGDEARDALEDIQKEFNDWAKKSLKGLPAIVRSIALVRGARFIFQLNKMIGARDRAERAYFLQVRERSAMVDAMVNIINHLNPGEKTKALLTPAFFRKENLGSYGRLTTALQLAALRQVEVDWIILVNEMHLTSSLVQEVLQRQREAYEWLCRFAGESTCNYGVSYAVALEQEYEDVLRNQETSIFLCVQPDISQQRLMIAPDYHGEFGTVAALRIWPKVKPKASGERTLRAEAQTKRWQKLEEALNKFRSRKISIHSYHL